jgi:hypothetical protein
MAAYSLKTGRLAATCDTYVALDAYTGLTRLADDVLPPRDSSGSVLVSYDHERASKAPLSADLRSSLEACVPPSGQEEASSKL